MTIGSSGLLGREDRGRAEGHDVTNRKIQCNDGQMVEAERSTHEAATDSPSNPEVTAMSSEVDDNLEGRKVHEEELRTEHRN